MTTNQNIFDTLVGISGVGTPADTVNTLNGITENVVAFLTLEDGGTKAAMFDKVKSQAYEFLESELIGGLSGYKDFSSVISSTAKVNVNTGMETITATGIDYVGCVVRINRIPDKTKLVISGIDFVSDRAFNSNIVVYNLLTGAEVHTSSISVVVGVNEIIINKDLEFNFGSGLYFIGFLPLTGAKFTELNNYSGNSHIVQKSGYLPLTSLLGINNVVEVAPSFNVLCSIEYSYTKIIEDNKQLLVTAFKYACGFVMLDRVLVSKQADRETLINREAQEALSSCYREDAIKFIKNARNEIYGKLNKVGSLQTDEKRVEMYSLSSFV